MIVSKLRSLANRGRVAASGLILALAAGSASAASEDERAARFASALQNVRRGVAVTQRAVDSDAIQKFAEDIAQIKKLSGALGTFGAGLDLVVVLAGGKSDTDRILDAIERIGVQIAGVERRTAQLITEGFNKVAYDQLKASVGDEISPIDNAVDEWKFYQRDPGPTRLERLLLSYGGGNSSDMRGHARALANHCTGQNELDMFDILEAYSFGDARVIADWGARAMLAISQAKMIDAFVFRAQAEEEARRGSSGVAMTAARAEALQSRAEDFADKRYADLLDACADRTQAALDRVLRKVHSNSKKFVSTKLDDLPADPEVWVETLKAKYPQREWVVAIWPEMRGFQNHNVSGRRTHTFLHQRMPAKGAKVKGETVNFVAHHFDMPPEMTCAPIKIFGQVIPLSCHEISLLDLARDMRTNCESERCLFSTNRYSKFYDDHSHYPPDSAFKAWAGRYDIRLLLTGRKRPPFLVAVRKSELERGESIVYATSAPDAVVLASTGEAAGELMFLMSF